MKNKSLFAKSTFGVVFLSLLLIFVFASCDEFFNLFETKCCEDCKADCVDCLAGVCANKCGNECCKEDIDLEGNCKLITDIFIPNYDAISHVRLSIRGIGTVYTEFDTMGIKEGSINHLVDVPDGFPGVVWTGTFTDIKALTYAPGSLKIDLLDNNKTVISSGYNSSSVTATDNQTAVTIINPVPVNTSADSGSLTQGEMKFWKIDLHGDHEYKLTLTAVGSWPDIILFNNDGTYNKYYSISGVSDAAIELSPAQTVSYYIGIYADAGNVSQYNITLGFNLLSSEFIDDFENGNFDGWEKSRNNTGIALAEIVYENTERGYVIEFKAANTAAGLTSSISRNITSTAPMALSFLIKTDLNIDFGVLDLYINDIKIKSYAGLRGTWKSETILVSAGTNKIEFVLEKETGQHNTGDITNTIRLDDISFVSDTTSSVVLYPRGNLNAYVGAPANEKITFSAEALRKDGSVRKDATGFTFSGSGINSSTGVFTPAAAGNVSITVTQGGKSASRNVTVHPANYIRLPYTYPGTGITYNGYSGTEGSLTTTTGGVTITYPSATTFSADGFFTIEGSVNNPTAFNYARVLVEKTGVSGLQTEYYVRDNFKQRIWLRFGSGEYTVKVYGLNSITTSSNLGAEGDITGVNHSSSSITFNVTNTRNDGKSADGSTADRRFIYPSYVVQSDDFRIINLASDLTFGLTDSTEKIRALHDYITSNTSYDYNSTVSGNRKKQDALTVIGTRYYEDTLYPDGHFFAVCEGYSNLFAALVRASGFEIRYVSGNSHGWNNVYLNGWKLVDVTHDDPVRASGVIGDYGPYSFRYTYFMLDNLSRDNYPHSITDKTNERFVDPSAPWQTNGWY